MEGISNGNTNVTNKTMLELARVGGSRISACFFSTCRPADCNPVAMKIVGVLMKKPLIICALIACAASAANGWAQNCPNRASRFVVPTAPGGGPDVVARFIAPRLTELLGQQVVVENRQGELHRFF